MDLEIVTKVTEMSGLAADRSRFLICMMSCFPLAIFFSLFLQPKVVGSFVRYLFQLVVGLAFCYFCFKLQVLLLLLDTGVCYVLLNVCSPGKVHIAVFVWAITFMSVSHIYRMYTDYNGYTLDFTGPSMIITMKVTSLACSVYDGMWRKKEDLSEDQNKLAVRAIPGVIEYFSYMFCFTSILSGPSFNFVDYADFISGKDVLRSDGKERSALGGLIPCILKFVTAVFFISMTFILPYNFDPFFDKEWRSTQPWWYVTGHLWIACFVTRCNYYFAWILADAVSNLSGFGFNGIDSSGKEQWNKITNVYPHKTECSSSLKLLIDNWNVGTANWLRRVCYERSPWSPTNMTYLLSATWHGFYPGYYGCFLSMSFFLLTSRKLRRVVRPHFISSAPVKFFYDCLTTICSLILINFASIQLCLLSFERNNVLYRYYYCLPHIVCAVIYVFCPKPKAKTQ